MGIPQYTLAWNAYQKNICNGLGTLQERGEFVDMTLAADGHYVKVHKMVMSLVSPYIKDLITSAECAHPVIFLNQISYKTLCLILEYVYTGQVSVDKDCLGDVIQAGKALYIKGLIDMVESCYAHIADNETRIATLESNDNDSASQVEEELKEGTPEPEPIFCETEGVFTTEVKSDENKPESSKQTSPKQALKSSQTKVNDSQIQYTMSNQGNLQIVLNRFVYNVRYLYRNSKRRMWRCIFYPKQQRCPAYLITEDNRIVERCCTHNHGFHDKSIMRKVREGKVFSVLKDAQLEMEIQKRTKLAEEPADT